MKANEAGSSTINSTAGTSAAESGTSTRPQPQADAFFKVLDGRRQPIRGLWIRGTRFYAQLRVENPITGVKKTRRVPLADKDGSPVQTAAQAVAELKRLQTQRADNALPIMGRMPLFTDYAKQYLDFIGSGQGANKPATVEAMKAKLGLWAETIGQLRLDQIKRAHVNRFIEKRLRANMAPATINTDVIGLRVVLKRALSDGLIQRLPTEGLRPLKVSRTQRALVATADLDRLCKAAFETQPTQAQRFVDYIRVMAASGCRRNEALGLQWADVDFDHEQLHVRRQVTHRGIEDLKNREGRTLDFNPALKRHLLEMKTRNGDASQWLFPSPLPSEEDLPASSFAMPLYLARAKAGMPTFVFHDCRHHFVSMCVMSGIDYMTIAAWVGHKDGGVLIGKVYGHLANEHRKLMAKRLNFAPVVLEQAANQ
jgi:integrase